MAPLATYTWQGDDATDPTNWHVAANWDLTAVPTSQDIVVIPFTAHQPVVKQPGQTAEAGDLTIQSNAILTINPGFTLNVSRKLIQYGKIAGGGIAVVQDMDWYSGSLDNVQATLNGVLTVKGTSNKYVYSTALTIAIGARVVQEATASDVNVYGMPATPATIENLGTWDLQGDAGLGHYAMIPPEMRGTFHNAAGATFKKSGGTGKSRINVTMDNDGVVEVHTGELELQGRDSQSVSSDGWFLIKTGSTLVLTQGDGAYSCYIGAAGAIKDFSPTDHGNVRFELGANVVDGEYNISGATTALSAPPSSHTLNKITSLGFVNLPEANNASLTFNGAGRTFDHLYDVENHTGGVLTVNFATFNVGTAANPKNYTQTCNSHGLCTLAGTGVVQVWGTATWYEGTIQGLSRATDTFIAKGPVLLDDSSWKYLKYRTFETNAGLTFRNGSMRVTSSTIHNSATSAWDVQCDCDVVEYLTVDSFFENDGLLLKSAGSISGESEFNLVLNSRSLVDLRQGVFDFDDGGTSPGDFAVAVGTLLRFHGDHMISGDVCGNASGVLDCAVAASTGSLETWDGGSTHFSGLYLITGGTTVKGCCYNETTWDVVPQSLGPLTVMDLADAYFIAGPITTPYDVTVRDGGIMGLNFPDQATTFTVNGTYRQLDTSGATPWRQGIGTLILAGAGPHVWADGYWNTGGKTVVNTGVALAIDTATASAYLYAHTLENHGAVTWSGVRDLVFYSTGTIPMTVDNWGSWDIQTDADMDYGASIGQNTINNWGTFQKSAGSGETVVLADFNNRNGGVFAVNAGSIYIKYNDLVNDQGGTVIIGLDRTLAVDERVTNNGKIQQTQSEQVGGGFARQFAMINNHAGNLIRYRGVDVVPVGGRMDTTTVSVWGNQHCGTAIPSIAGHLFGDTGKNASYAVLRCYEITPTTPQTADITFYYLANTAPPPWPPYWPDERNANSDPYAWHHNDVLSRWDMEARGAKDNTTNGYRFVQATGVNDYSVFALLDYSGPPTAVKLSRMEADSHGAAGASLARSLVAIILCTGLLAGGLLRRFRSA